MSTVIDKLYQQLKSSPANLAQYIHDDVAWHVSAPVNTIVGSANVLSSFWQPLVNALPDIERKPFINVQSEYEGYDWIASTGYFVGTLSQPLWGIPANNKTLYLRYTELVQLDNNKIKTCYVIVDFLDAMNQVGVNPLRKSLGHSGLIMPPTTMDGIARAESSADAAQKSKQLILDMLDELGRFDGKSLSSMKLENYWHPDFMWYGPAGHRNNTRY
ncbi:ester cyclase [Colwellia sp. MSW7]|uniref:Ester cyclase n=1 Tax=Colwellia maritima TaxID=2912588 RepID=A0ABS9X5C2_9GAMM|nr:ester cyclase [Colwellia maritima]MCI2285421.1 ester cyclase [Colwellia maritima]